MASVVFNLQKKGRTKNPLNVTKSKYYLKRLRKKIYCGVHMMDSYIEDVSQTMRPEIIKLMAVLPIRVLTL